MAMLAMTTAALHAAAVTVWQIGDDEDPFLQGYSPANEFSQESYTNNPPPGQVTRLPGDPLYNASNNPARDDDHYLAGAYPSGFNGLTTALNVPNSEPPAAFERALSNNDTTNRIHFFLTPEQAASQSRLRLTFELVEGGIWIGSPVNTNGDGFGTHHVSVRFKTQSHNTLVMEKIGLDRETRFSIDIPASAVSAVAGPNTIEISRTGPSLPPNHSSWIQFDFVKLEADTAALADADADGLPNWWESDHHLSDSNAADASGDADLDGLTASQEYNGGILSSDPNRSDTDGDQLPDNSERAAGTNPKLADTDADGLSDAEELAGTPVSSPLLSDSDGDGAPDAWERRVGSNPSSPSSTPAVFRGAIGLNFVSAASPNGSLAWFDPAGQVPQMRWNNTVPMNSWNRTSGNSGDVASPAAGVLTRSDGAALSGTTYSWTGIEPYTSGNNGSPDQRMLSGLLRASTETPLTLTLTGIPFSNYHVIAYVGGSYDGQRGRLRLDNDPLTDRGFTTFSTAPQSKLVPAIPTAAISAPVGNTIRYENRTGGTLVVGVTMLEGYGGVGLHGIQIIDAALDADASGLPDWFEMQYALQPATPSLAGADPDGDGLTHLQEAQRGSNPHLADTDGDGLTDGAESAANALNADSDGDGVSDSIEVAGPIPTNPNAADTDNDGISDSRELALGLDPAFNPSGTAGFTGWVPAYTSAPASWEWKIENIQIVWDHGGGAHGGGNGDEDTMLRFLIRNQIAGGGRAISMALRTDQGKLTYFLESDNSSAFSGPGNPGGGIWSGDPNNPVMDLTTSAGFSGYGPNDISDRLSMRLLATRGATNSWTLLFEIKNLTRGTTMVSRTVADCTAAASVDNGTATWGDSEGNPGLPDIDVHQGVRLFLTPTPLESLPAFAAAADTDNDGMPNSWENAHFLNPNSAADASTDIDGDGLRNRDEYLAGTNPRLADTDGDLIDDRTEREQSSNPLDPAVRPAFAGGPPPSGADFNGNGYADAWEIAYQVAGLSPDADADGDGASNAQEAMWGTDPFDNTSTILIGLEKDGNHARLRWTEAPWKRQRLFRSTTLGSWSQVTNPPFAENGELSVTLANQFTAAPRAFFRVETKDRDSDGDGVSDWDEAFIGSDPYRRDSTRASAPIIDVEGNVTGNMAGDLAAFAQALTGTLPGAPPTPVTRAQAARFLQQASFGPTEEEMDRVQKLGIEGWMDDQIHNQPATLHRPYIDKIYADVRGPRVDLSYNYNGDNSSIEGNNATTPFARAAIAGPDQLRQRVAFALSQILVTSRRDPNLANRPLAMMDYYDIFVRRAFGNYRDILGEVSLHPVMGRYLSHIGNQKARPDVNQYPDENYARELMQLFTIGLWELNPDGTRKTGPGGAPVPTYRTSDITELARVFTGLWFGGQSWGEGGWIDEHSTVPMEMWSEKHDHGTKLLLGGFSIPERPATPENGMRDIHEALDNLFRHPNTAPFVSRQLIQFLVTSNPTPAYVARVSAVFSNNGSGVSGDLGAVVKAVLSDTEARDSRWSHGAPSFGRLKEPVHRAMALARVARFDRFPNLVWWNYGDFYEDAHQEPTASPSVFNFFRPDYQPPGSLTTNHLAAPAFQITDSYTSIAFVNRLWEQGTTGFRQWDAYKFAPDYRDLLALASDPPALVDRTNLLFCGGMMSAATRDLILSAIGQAPASNPLLRVQLAVFLSSACPEGAIQR